MPRSRAPSPFDLVQSGLQVGFLAAEAQAVIAMRLWGFAGFWNVTPFERQRMVSEKAGAMTQSALNAAFAAMRGKRPDEVLDVAIRPLRQKTRSNSRRLAKRGPKLR
ncbi:antifreeze protein [Sulfitobacter sp. D35]|uniref:antifreeze protein n=1 Tax=Sulfitobacter sp. D35 TaxID=3083252 RepID=UPI00296E48A4|nr:antifreeze protein [Sulfitobacter sp. D35]MDW4497332.1 antifreeze protein [Sulfitobacter sp. D35]